MASPTLSLLGARRFLPLFITQFLGAMNDNVFKNALIILVLYRLTGDGNGQILVTLAAGIFVLPFFLFSATAGQIADKFEKSGLIRRIKLAEILVMALGVWALHSGSPALLIGILFLMGTQSAFFGPLKYGILPGHLREQELVAGNGLIEGGTFVAILIGTVVGGVFVLRDNGITIISSIVLVMAGLGYIASRGIPEAPATAKGITISVNILAETWRIVAHAGNSRNLFLSILGISWFWLVGATFLSQFPILAKDVLGGNEEVVTLLLTAFAVGIGVGSTLCGRLLKGEVSAKFIPIAAIAMTVFITDFYIAVADRSGGETLVGAAVFLATSENWRVLFDLVAIAVAGGLYSVPLYAILQNESAPEHRSRNIAANNIVNSLFMVAGALLAGAMLASGFTVPGILLALAIVNVVVAVYICRLLPHHLIKTIFVMILRPLFRVRVEGLENYRKAGERAVIVANHVSFLDGILLAAFLPGRPVFAVDTHIAQQWWARPFLSIARTFTVDPTNPFATKSLVHEVRQGNHLVIFPEGRITVTGALMKIHEGPGMIADKAGADLVPIRIAGAEASTLSRMKGKIRQRWFPRITITILPPRRFEIPADAIGRARRKIASQQLYDVMSDLIFQTCDLDKTLYQSLLEARRTHGGGAEVLEDIDRKPVNYNRIILGSLVLGRALGRISKPKERIGFLLPNSVGAAVTLFSLISKGQVPAMLNFSSGPGNVVSACRTAELSTVLTSRRFIEMGKLEALIEAIEGVARVVYLEDIRDKISLLDKILGFASRPFAGWLHRRIGVKASDPAVVLFTSGSEGMPKGVVLSHANLLANRYQLAARVDFNASDIALNALPIFHSFGLTGGLILPLLSGVRTFLYPSPLHYRIVPALVYDTNATILFGTDTFLTGYARMGHAYDFFNVRYVFAGAEKVKDETRRIWSEKFGLRILEGYGATETAPVLAANTPMHFKPGTVGRLVPGMTARLEQVPGVEEGGRLFVTGPNVMLGYLLADEPGVLKPPPGGEYDTGDIVDIDGDGFLSIVGRAKRFAKIAGEMVSLAAVEALASKTWPEHAHAVVALPDERKGEQLVLVTEMIDPARDVLLATAQAEGATELMVPRVIVTVDAVPVLGTGKVDYPAVSELAAARL
jgi:acyl-[acyl-carrier-protein]-phospholipid O-acyltransferase / long-chain-fatty-acid--[acyl-carrier-protein] ligase